MYRFFNHLREKFLIKGTLRETRMINYGKILKTIIKSSQTPPKFGGKNYILGP